LEKHQSPMVGEIGLWPESKRASLIAGPLLTNPLNSCTKLQIRAT